MGRAARAVLLAALGLSLASLAHSTSLGHRVTEDAAMFRLWHQVYEDRLAHAAERTASLAATMDALGSKVAHGEAGTTLALDDLRRSAAAQEAALDALEASLRLDLRHALSAAGGGDARLHEALGAVGDALAPYLPPEETGFVKQVLVDLRVRRMVSDAETGEVYSDETQDTPGVHAAAGFVVSPGRFATAGHVLQNESEEHEGLQQLASGEYRRAKMRVETTIAAACFLHDDALIPLKFRPWPGSGADVVIAGFDPLKYDGPHASLAEEVPGLGAPVWVLTEHPEFRKTGPILAPGTIAGPRGVEPYERTVLTVLPVWYGYSGSPVLYRGRAVGVVCHLFHKGGPGLMAFTPLEDLVAAIAACATPD